MLPKLTKLKGMALDLLFPQWCIGCGGEGSFLCQACQRNLSRISPPICPRCGKPQSNGQLCSGCIEWSATIDGIRSPFRFEGVIREAVHQLKYRNLRAIVPSLAVLLNDYIRTLTLPADVLVPVPLHRKRLRERGYNQSLLLAKGLGRLNGLPIIDSCLVRQKDTPPQARTSTVEERRDNVIGVFSCRDDQLRDRKVLLIDDVATSGATLDACATVLKASGAASVWALVLAREI
ncbi:MAG: ComF family protein [Dehalococcoidales bacterium]|nr:MAG: ComF family protein [Dehalococcoidales bacterium]